MVNQKKVEYNERGQRVEKSLKYFAIEERNKRNVNEDDPLEGILEESLYINTASQSGELLSQYCLPTPKSLNRQMIIENYDYHIDSSSMMKVKYEDMDDLRGRIDLAIDSFGKLSFEKDENEHNDTNSSLFDGMNFEINQQLKNYKSNFENKRLTKFLSCDKNQKSIFDFIKPSHKRKPGEPQLSGEQHQSSLKKQKLISEYTCHQTGEEMFDILDRNIERKKQIGKVRTSAQVVCLTSDRPPTILSQSTKQTSTVNQPPTTLLTMKSIEEPLTTENKPKSYMERIKDQAKQFHSKHTKSTLTIKKKEIPKSRDILKEDDNFPIPQGQVETSVINALFSY